MADAPGLQLRIAFSFHLAKINSWPEPAAGINRDNYDGRDGTISITFHPSGKYQAGTGMAQSGAISRTKTQNGRDNQLRSLSEPVDNLNSKWAYMLMMSLTWNLKA